jgi:hypothetical protein
MHEHPDGAERFLREAVADQLNGVVAVIVIRSVDIEKLRFAAERTNVRLELVYARELIASIEVYAENVHPRPGKLHGGRRPESAARA